MLNRLQNVFASLEKRQVKYVVIGGIAAVLHGVPRATFDLDILIEATPDNVRKLLDAFLEAKLGTASLVTVEEVLDREITIFEDRVRIDVQTETPGIDFNTAWQNKEIMQYRGREFFVLSKNDLISSQKAAGRRIDLEDVKLLELPDIDEATEKD